MVFSSLLFLFRFLPIMLITYYAVPNRLRNGVFFLGSLFFYAWGEPVYVCLLLFSTLVDYSHGKLIGIYQQKGRPKAAKYVLLSSVVINLGLLGYFKYSGFITGILNSGLSLNLPMSDVALPIGISFYTFQTMSYTIDVYRKQARVQDNIIAFGAYVSMFPQLIAGPIVRYQSIAKELTDRKETIGQFAGGIRRFIIGLGKKVLIANQMGALWNEIQGIPGEERTVVMVWLGILAFGMQIYFDFSGYSDMAVGMGQMFGFHFPENFRYPYTAGSITDFWRRWHISLGTWFREYVYIPLGGNRKGKAAQIRNILIVWLLTGIWHGAGWNFLLWGVYFGVLLLLEKLCLMKWLVKLPLFLQGAYAMLLVYLGWVLFAHDDLGAGVMYYRQMLGMDGIVWGNGRTWYLLFGNLALIAAAILGSTPLPAKWSRSILGQEGKAGTVRTLVLEGSFIVGIFLLVTAYLVDASYNPFLYFRF